MTKPIVIKVPRPKGLHSRYKYCVINSRGDTIICEKQPELMDDWLYDEDIEDEMQIYFWDFEEAGESIVAELPVEILTNFDIDPDLAMLAFTDPI